MQFFRSTDVIIVSMREEYVFGLQPGRIYKLNDPFGFITGSTISASDVASSDMM